MTEFPRPRFVKAVKGRRGETFLYWSRPNHPRIRLQSPDRSWPLLWEAFGHFIASERAPSRAPTPRSLLHYIAEYEASADFQNLTPRVQRNYGRWLREFRADLGELDVADLTPYFLTKMRDAWNLRGYEAANTALKVLKPILTRARIAGAMADADESDPLSLVAKVDRPHGMGEAHPIWTEDELSAALAWCLEAGADGLQRAPGLGRALALARYAGFRRQSVCSVPRSARRMVPDEDGVPRRRLVWLTEKRKVLADKPEDPRLTEVLKVTPDKALTIAYNADGQPWKERQLNQAVTRLMDRLARAGLVRSFEDEAGAVRCPLTIHGLRHARGVELADAGASDAEIMAQIDHATTRAAAIYRRQAERRKLANAGQEKIDNVVSLKNARKAQRKDVS